MTKISNQYSLTNVLTADPVNGRVGIGTASPTVPLDVVGAGKFSTTVTAQTGFKLPANGNGTSPTIAYNNSLGFGVSGTGIFFGNLYNSDLSTAMQLRVTNSGGTDITALTITPTGNVGIGTSSPNQLLTLSASAYPILGFNIGSTAHGYVGSLNATGIILNSQQALPIFFYTSDTERMRITSAGNVLIGTTSALDKFVVNGGVRTTGIASGNFFDDRSSSNFFGWYAQGGQPFFFNGAVGNIVSINPSNGAYSALSNIDKKKDFEQSNIGLNEVMQLKPTLYRFKTDDDSSPKDLGFIAQEVKDFIPQAYVETGEGEDKFIGLNQMPLIAALTKAIQDQQTQINELKALLNA